MTVHQLEANVDNNADTDSEPLLSVRDLRVYFDERQSYGRTVEGAVKAVDGVSFDIYPSETLGLVGESGSGKSTIAQTVTRLVPATAGRVIFDGRDILSLSGEELRLARRNIQIVFQDPGLSLNPRMRVDVAVAEPLLIHKLADSKEAAKLRARELLEICGLGPRLWDRSPSELSGGQQQRVALARALALRPKLIVADEPTSALDVSVQAKLMDLMLDLQKEFAVSYLLISHDLAVVRHLADRIAVMYAGRLMESGEAGSVCDRPRNPYTQALLSASPIPDPDIEARRERIILRGEIPDPRNPPDGCRFHTRCPLVENRCRSEQPPLDERGAGHLSACWVL